MLDWYWQRSLNQARQFEIACGIRVNTIHYCTGITLLRATQREDVAVDRQRWVSFSRELGIALHQAPGIESFPSSVHRCMWSSHKVRFEKESNSGTASDPARDPRNVQGWPQHQRWSFIFNCQFHQKRTGAFEY